MGTVKKQTKYVGDVPSLILVDVREPKGLMVRKFSSEINFFDFLADVQGVKDITIEQIWRYTCGGGLAELEVAFRGRLMLIEKS